ncbi:MAG: hypothetical protein ACU0BS_00250 [Hasllibacter sp.]
MRTVLIPLVLLALLPGCARQLCLHAATRELTRTERLLAESEQALARGYRLEAELVPAPAIGLTLCANRDAAGLCVAGPDPQVRQRPVAVDPVAERRIRDNLRAQVSRLRAQAQRDVAACPA